MDPIRVSTRELEGGGVADAFAHRFDARGLVSTNGSGAPAVRGAVRLRGWAVRGARLLRNALLTVAVMTLVPIGLVAVVGDQVARMTYRSDFNVGARAAAANRMRAFMVPRDPGITPSEAGARLNAIQYRYHPVAGFEAIRPDLPPALPWRTSRSEMHAPDMFPTARPDLYEGPSSRTVLEAAAKGLSRRELMYLASLAHAPVWRDFDLIARAEAVDIVGGMLRLPFGKDALPWQRPLPSYRETRELAHAAVSRAAYYVAIGQRDSAEAVLRSIVSVGFMLVDNGSTSLDVMIGTVIVGVGRDALQRFYLLEHDPRAALPALRPLSQAALRVDPPASLEEARRRYVARIADPAAPLGERFGHAGQLSMITCTNVREMMFGPRADVVSAIAEARRTLPRFPSERAVLELDLRPLADPGAGSATPLRPLMVSAAAVSGIVLQNPRLLACTRVLSRGW
jgi:hypothetical protein